MRAKLNTKRFPIYLDKALYARLEAQATEERIGMGPLIRRLIALSLPKTGPLTDERPSGA